MKWLSCAVTFCAFSINVFGAEPLAEFVPPRGIVSVQDVDRMSCWYTDGLSYNSRDTNLLKQKLLQHVIQDDVATKAMDIFLASKFWHLVDFYEDHSDKMTLDDSQLFCESLVLAAPQLGIGNYTARVVSIVGNPLLITADFFRNRSFLFDMFCYCAVETAKLGYAWILTEMCINVCDELELLAERYSWPECEQFKAKDVRHIAYNRRLTEDRLPLSFKQVWPNLL
jgi:hypothetical protein